MEIAQILGVGICPAAGLPAVTVLWKEVDGELRTLLEKSRAVVVAPAFNLRIVAMKVGIRFGSRIANLEGSRSRATGVHGIRFDDERGNSGEKVIAWV